MSRCTTYQQQQSRCGRMCVLVGDAEFSGNNLSFDSPQLIVRLVVS